MDLLTEKLHTWEDLMRMSGKGRYELIHGVIFEMSPAGEEHGYIALNIGSIIRNFVKEHKLGIATGAETGYKLTSNPDTVRAPDVAFKSNKRLSEGGLSKGYSTVIPELVVEVNSPADSYIKVLKKVNEWLKAGVIEVWLIDPEDRSIAVYDSSGNYRILDGNQVLEGGDILPGFKCKLDDVFN